MCTRILQELVNSIKSYLTFLSGNSDILHLGFPAFFAGPTRYAMRLRIQAANAQGFLRLNWSKYMNRNFIRTGVLTLALVLGAAVAMPSLAQPLAVPTGHQSTQIRGTQGPLGECERITHANFCYCTGSCGPA